MGRQAWVVRTACLLLALAGLDPIPTQAQTQILVSNLGSASGATSLGTPWAQTFQTGNAPGGYALSSVTVLFDGGTNGYPRANLCSGTIRSDSSDGKPGSTLVTLTNPSTFVNDGENEFTAPGELVLAANTRHHFVLDCDDLQRVDSARWARSSAVNAGNGWRIFSERHQQTNQGSWTKYQVPYAIEIEGEANDAPLPTISVEPVSSPVQEGEDARFRVERTANTAGALTVNYSVSESGYMVSSSHEGDRTVAFAPGDAAETVSVPTQNNSSIEADSEVTLTLRTGSGYNLGSDRSATVTVRDDDDPRPTGLPTIHDTTPEVGQTLTADVSGIDDADGLTAAVFTYQWVRVLGGSGTNIAGATANAYTVRAADWGATLKVRVSFTDDGGQFYTLESAETAAVEGDAAELSLPSVTSQAFVSGMPVTVTLPTATGGAAPYTYTLTSIANRPLRYGLSFNPNTRDLSADLIDADVPGSEGGWGDFHLPDANGVHLFTTGVIYKVTDAAAATAEREIELNLSLVSG